MSYSFVLQQQLDELELLQCVYNTDGTETVGDHSTTAHRTQNTVQSLTSDEQLATLREIADMGSVDFDNDDIPASVPLIKLRVVLLREAPCFVVLQNAIKEDLPFLVMLDITFPRNYPTTTSFDFTLIPNDKMQMIEFQAATHTIHETLESFEGMCCVQLVMEEVKERLMEMRRNFAEWELEKAVEKNRNVISSQGEDDFDQEAILARILSALETTEGDEEEEDGDTDRYVLGRRCVYFHHILSTAKRQCITNWARTLKLGGFCKIGYPGILIVEGSERSCVEYIRGLQQLRWKLMVVRGEEKLNLRELSAKNDEDNSKSSSPNDGKKHRRINKKKSQSVKTTSVSKHHDDDDTDDEHHYSPSSLPVVNTDGTVDYEAMMLNPHRRVPHGIGIRETVDSSEIGTWCRECGLQDIFRTSMKIYKN